MTFSFEPFLAISAGHIMAVSAGPEHKSAKSLNGKQVAALFTQYQVWEYLYSCFEALHTTCANYIVEDINLYIQARQPA